jgi:hypothetical protein
MHASTKASPHARLISIPLAAISLCDGFWSKRQEINRQVSLRHGYRNLEQSGNINNLRLAAGLSQGSYKGPLFMDSDVYKWLEAVAYELANTQDIELEQQAEQTIDLLAAAQKEDGYLNSYYQIVEPGKRWSDLDHGHEMYCAGHLIQAAIAHHRSTGRTKLLDVACRFADHIDSIFGHGQREGACGHPEIEMALVELYRETGQIRYLELAGFFIDQRGRGRMKGMGPYGSEYHQDRVPVRKAIQVEGHAVRQLYLNSGATDLYLETGETALLEALLRLWHDTTARKMYLTGGYGARFEGESFGDAYELPSDRCYCETCASIGAMMWNWRMLLATGEARFADSIERTLYNGFLSGVSLDGRSYFYVNPLQSRGGIERQGWYGCACCPPNVMRQITSIGHYIATQDAEGVQLHQYIPAKIHVEHFDGFQLSIRIQTDYPWDGRVKVIIDETGPSPWRLRLRVPGWCTAASLQVNGQLLNDSLFGSTYADVKRVWRAGDVIELHFPMQPRFIQPNPRIDAVRGSLAIERGPLVYCIEQADQPSDTNLLDIQIDRNGALVDSWQENLLGGVVAVEVQGVMVDVRSWEDQLYRPLTLETLPQSKVKLIAIPYYAWANRGPGAMRVWFPGI